MAKDDDIDMARADAPSAAKKPRKRRLLLIAVAAILIAGGAAFYLLGIGKPPSAAEDQDGEKTADPVAPALYLALEPSFIVNFEEQGELRFLQVAISIMTHDPKVVEAATYHMARIRNALILLLGDQGYDTISTLPGKEKLRAVMLDDIQKVMTEATGSPGVEAVYFTSFVMQ